MDRKEKLINGLNIKNCLGVEIGALFRPTVTPADGAILYVDYTDTATLKERYKDDPNVDVGAIVEVDGIWGENTLSEALHGQTVDYIIASHVIEHVPDLVTWLSELQSVLSSSGQVRLAVPDRRFTFDFLRSTSELPEVLHSYIVRARVPQPHSILDFCINAAEIDCVNAWEGRITRDSVEKRYTVQGSMDVANDALKNGTYHDVHCWVFTPKSFASLFLDLACAGFTDFACDSFHDTEHYQLEFFVTLRRSENRNQIIDSWLKMRDLAQENLGVTKHSRELIALDQQVAEISDQLTSQKRDAESQIASLREQIASIETAYKQSTSWKITTPVRLMGAFFKKLG